MIIFNGRRGNAPLAVWEELEAQKYSGSTLLIKLAKSAGVETFYPQVHGAPDKFSSDMHKEWT